MENYREKVVEQMKELQDQEDFSKLMMISEEMKSYPFGAVWDHYCESEGVPVREAWYTEVEAYEKNILSKRI